jgi:hypothetical protein
MIPAAVRTRGAAQAGEAARVARPLSPDELAQLEARAAAGEALPVPGGSSSARRRSRWCSRASALTAAVAAALVKRGLIARGVAPHRARGLRRRPRGGRTGRGPAARAERAAGGGGRPGGESLARGSLASRCCTVSRARARPRSTCAPSTGAEGRGRRHVSRARGGAHAADRGAPAFAARGDRRAPLRRVAQPPERGRAARRLAGAGDRARRGWWWARARRCSRRCRISGSSSSMRSTSRRTSRTRRRATTAATSR